VNRGGIACSGGKCQLKCTLGKVTLTFFAGLSCDRCWGQEARSLMVQSPPSSGIPKSSPLPVLPFRSTGCLGAEPSRRAWSGRKGQLVTSAARPLAGPVDSAVHIPPGPLPQTVLTRFCLATARRPTVRLELQLSPTQHDWCRATSEWAARRHPLGRSAT